MPTVDALMSKHISNAITNKQTWGGIIYNVKAYGAKGDGTTDDTSNVQLTLDNKGKIIFPKATYLIKGMLTVYENTIIDLNGSTINFELSSTVPGFWVKGDNVTICNGTINVTGTTMGGSSTSLSCITAGHESDGVGYENLKFTDLTLSTNRNDAGGAIMIFGECRNVLIENIIIPDNPNLRNVISCHWGGTPENGTGHPHNIDIRNIKIGKLTYPSYGIGGWGYGVYLSACFNVNIENISMEQGHGLVMVTRGDYANTYAPAKYKDLVGTGIKVDNASIEACYGYGIRVDGSNRSATLDNVSMSSEFTNIKIVGAKVEPNNNVAFYVEQSKDVRLNGFEFSGVLAIGINTGSNNDNLIIENGSIKDCELYGIQLANEARNAKVRNVHFQGNNKNEGTTTSTAALVIAHAIRPIVENCTFGEIGVAETQKYSIAVALTSAVDPKLNNNHTYNLAGVAGAGSISIPTSVNAYGHNNTVESGLTNIVSGRIYTIQPNGTRVFYGDSTPVSGDFNVGDTMYYNSVSAGGFIGEVCTVAGNPGTWKTFGSISV